MTGLSRLSSAAPDATVSLKWLAQQMGRFGMAHPENAFAIDALASHIAKVAAAELAAPVVDLKLDATFERTPRPEWWSLLTSGPDTGNGSQQSPGPEL